MPVKVRKTAYNIFILGLLSAMGPFSIDMYLPGFPAIAKDLHTTVGNVSLSLSSFFIGISAGQFLYGPLLDRFGRKRPMYIGLGVYVLASMGWAMSVPADGLVALWFLQALGSCGVWLFPRYGKRSFCGKGPCKSIFPADAGSRRFSYYSAYAGRFYLATA